jgi:hypothetical protein
MSETATDFRIVIANFEQTVAEDEISKRRLAAINGVDPKLVDPDEVLKLLHDLDNGLSKFDVFALKYLWNHPADPHRLKIERTQQFLQRTESWLGVDNRVNSYGLHIPSYLPALRETDTGSDVHKAVLVGAFSKDTATEYTAAVASVFPRNDCSIIDLEGIETPHASQARFIRGDGMALASHFSEVDSIHTNALFRTAVNQSPLIHAEIDNLGTFGEQALKALNPDGKLIMIEANGDLIRQALFWAGFRSVEVEPAEAFKTRRIMDRHIYQGLGSIRPVHTRIEVATDIIIATK